jgi:Tol biopolymer transport system component
VWIDRGGKEISRVGDPANYQNPELSPDGKRLVFQRADPAAGLDLWIMELLRGTTTRFTSNPQADVVPVWSPDGSQIVYASGRRFDLFRKSSSGIGEEEMLLTADDATRPTDWSRDGRFIVYQKGTSTEGRLFILPLFGDRQTFPLSRGKSMETEGRFSPDGKFLAYVSNESGREEVYVQTFPPPGNRWQISTNGGEQPRWGRGGKELYYLALDRTLMVVDVQTANGFEPTIPRPLFRTRIPEHLIVGFNSFQYVATADGQQFLVNTELEGPKAVPINVVTNWKAAFTK